MNTQKKEKLIKFLNKQLNHGLEYRMRVLNSFGLFVRPKVYKDIRPIKHFKKTAENNWGSAPPNMASVYVEDCSSWFEDAVTIHTLKRDAVGVGFARYDKDGNPILANYKRGWSTGEVISTHTYNPVGDFSATLYISDTAVSNWDAFWFLGTGDTYQEVDFERMFGARNRWNEITISVHTGHSSTHERRMYSHNYRVRRQIFTIKFRFGKILRVYINGLLVFVGLQWQMKDPMKLRIGSGVIEKDEIFAKTGTFVATNIGYKRR